MKKILIVVDMQDDFISGSLGSPQADGIVGAAVNKIRSFDGDIFVTLDTHHKDYLDTEEGRWLPVPHCLEGTDGHELDRRVAAALDEKTYSVIKKGTFGSTELARRIAEEYAGERLDIELIGLCTDICVVSNALLLKAFIPEARISVDSACCAGVTKEKHLAALEVMRSCQIDVK